MTSIAAVLGADVDRGRLSEGVSRAVEAAGVPGVSGAVLPVGDLVDGVAELLHVPVGNLAVRAWRAHQDVVDAMRQTRAEPGSQVVVVLGRHSIRSTQEPTVDVSLDGVARQAVLRLSLTVLIDVEGVRLTVAEGRISRVSPGRASAEARLSAAGLTLLARRVGRVDLRPAVPAPRTGSEQHRVTSARQVT